MSAATPTPPPPRPRRALALVEFVSLDGVMQGFHASAEDLAEGFAPAGWGQGYLDDVQADAAAAELPTTTAYLFGRRTYEQMVRFWPDQPDANPIAAHLNRTPKYVATRTLFELRWGNARVLDGELEPAVEALKNEGSGTITVLGSGTVARRLVAAGLVDEYRLFVHPLVLGTGTRLFGDLDRPVRLRLADCRPTTTGVVMLRYSVGDGDGQV